MGLSPSGVRTHNLQIGTVPDAAGLESCALPTELPGQDNLAIKSFLVTLFSVNGRNNDLWFTVSYIFKTYFVT